MEFQQIESQCRTKAEELLQYYFGNLVKEVAIEQPETIGDYSPNLPKQSEAEYYDYLKSLWAEIRPSGSASFEEIIDKKRLSDLMTDDDCEIIPPAYDAAMHRNLWERITKTNHKDVTYYSTPSIYEPSTKHFSSSDAGSAYGKDWAVLPSLLSSL